MSACELIPIVRLLHDVTEAQIAAARSLEGTLLYRLNSRRIDVLFDLAVSLSQTLEEGDPDQLELAREIRRLQKAESRLTTIAGAVVDTLDVVLSQGGSKVYARSGLITE